MAAVAVPLRTKLVAGFDKPKPKPKPVAEPTHSIIYHPLDTKVDCTRFIQIKPAANDNDPIACQLVHSSFREHPSYQALSYRWGNVQQMQSITVNGVPFPVGNNLMGALRFLRRLQRQTGSKLVWIDAICINQNDDREKARQVGLMGQIYFRAADVVVWLGEKYSCYQKDLSPDILADRRRHERLPQGADKQMLQRRRIASNMVKDLIDDEYWQRLWIIQELGQARELQVGFGTWAAPWSQFVCFLQAFASSGRPLTFDLELREKTHQSHTLKQLLEEHQDALCVNRRDKVYGLVGLAVDGADFPIDYTKSTLQVWIDTMNYMSTHHLLAKDEWVKFGRLMESLLIDTGDQQAATLRDPAQWPVPSKANAVHP